MDLVSEMEFAEQLKIVFIHMFEVLTTGCYRGSVVSDDSLYIHFPKK